MKNILLYSLLVLFSFSCAKKDSNSAAADEEKSEESKEQNIREKAQSIHERTLTIDTHVDIEVVNFTSATNYTQDLPTQVNLPKMKKGGLDAVFLIVYTEQGELNEQGYKKAYENADAKFKAIHRLTEEFAPDQIELATTADDVRRIHDSGKKVALIGVENGYPIGEDLSKIQEFYERGARYFSVAHNGHNQLGDSNTGERDDTALHQGLSEMGKKAIAELNRLGIMIDLSHPAQSTNKQAMALSQAPVIASHSSARALNDVSRNLWDEELLALKENGGVVQAVALPSFVNAKKDAAHQKLLKEVLLKFAEENDLEPISWDDRNNYSSADYSLFLEKYNERLALAQEVIEEQVLPKAPPVDVKDFVDHIDYMVDLIGIDHVGISSDFDGGGGVDGWNDASETFNVTLELVERGYSEEDIKKLWGENLLRVMEEVEKIAQEIQSKE